MFKSETNSITFYRSSNELPEVCVVVFSSWGRRELASKVDGTNPLLEFGYDVVSVQSNCDDWHQGLPESSVQALREFLSLKYKAVYGYGLSMGAYGALAFASILGFKKVLALAPQYRIDCDFDRRWEGYSGRIKWKYTIEESARDFSGDVYIVYDPLTLDSIHVGKIKQDMPEAKMQELPIKYSSHAVSEWLRDAGILRGFPVMVLGHGIFGIDARSLKRGNSTHHVEIAKSLYRKRRYCASLDFIQKAIDLDAKSHKAYKHLSYIKNKYGQLEDAIEMVKKAIELAQFEYQKSSHMHHLSNLLKASGRMEEASEAIDKAVELSPANVTLWVEKSHMLVKLSKFENACELLEKAIDIGGESHEKYRYLSDVKNKLGQVEDAIEAVGRAIELAPFNHQKSGHMHHLSSLLKDSGRMAEAIAVIDNAIEIDPANGKLWWAKSHILVKLSRPEDAIEVIKRAIELALVDREKSGYLYHLSSLLKASGRMAEAGEAIDKAIALNPANEKLLVAKGHISAQLPGRAVSYKPLST